MEEDEYLKLPVEDRCVHKLWKARVSGYEEAVKLFNQWDGDDASWKKFHGQIKKFITDSNAVAQEKGLEAALAYVDNCDAAGRVVSDCVEGVVTKCLAAPKAKTKDLGRQVVLMFCEIEQHEKATEELIKGLGQKNPKVVAGSINCMAGCLRAFGAKVVKVSPLVKAALPTLDHRDKSVREEAKALIVEAFRWVGDVMKAQLNGLKPVQLTELEAEFDEARKEKAKPERLLRSQQQFVAVDEGDGDGEEKGNGEDDGDDGVEADDPYDLIDPVDILDKLPKNFYELVEEKKWQLRKEALEALHPLAQSPKISPSGDYGELSRVLKKFIGKDTNVMLVALAAQCLAGIARGLRGGFKNCAGQCLPVVLEKFKEKKANVVAALVEAADGLYGCLGIEAIQEDCLATLKHKTPTVNAETARLLARSFAKCPPALATNKKMVKGYVSALLECLNHSDPNVRESSSEALGVLMKILGEPAMNKLMPDLDPIKVNKVKEYCEKAVLTGKMPRVAAEEPAKKVVKKAIRGGGRPASTVSGGPKKKPADPKPVKADPEDAMEDDDDPPAPLMKKASTVGAAKRGAVRGGRGGARGGSSSSYASRKKSEDVDTGPPYTNTGPMKSQRFKDEQKLRILRWHFSAPRGEFVDQLKEQMAAANMNRTLMGQMFHSDFKQHLKAIETLSRHIGADTEALAANLDLILKWATLRFFETNPAVLLKALEYLNEVFAALADNSYGLHDIEASSFVPYLVNKSGDPKDQVRASVRTMFRSLRQVYPVSKLCPYILEGIKAKNAKQRAECLDDIGAMVRDYGINVLQPSPPTGLKEMAKQIADRDTSVRNAALNAITEAYFQVGEVKLYKMIGNLPDRDMAMLEERIKRTSKSRPPTSSNAGPPSNPQPPPPQQQQQQQEASNSGLPRPGSRTIPSGLRRYQPAGQQAQQAAESRLEAPAGKRSSPGSNRPVSGAFTLDLDKIESASSMEGSIGGPQLVNHNLEAIFNDEPILLPPSLAARRVPAGSRSLADNSEAHEALDVILAQVFNKDASACISALTQLDELIKDDEKVALLGSRIDQLLTACYMQYRHVLNNKLRTDNSNPKEAMRLFQYLTMVLMSTYHHAELTKTASSSTLHDLYSVIINILIEPRVEQMSDGTQLVRALNVLTVKMIDRSDRTNVTCAVVKLLGDAVSNGNNAKFVELVMKIMWKITRFLPAWMADKSNSIDIDSVLADLNEFLKSYPPAYWKKQESDMPLRTVKTALHTMVKVRGDAILDHVTRINDPQNSELVAYIRKLLNNGIGKENNSDANGVGSAPATTDNRPRLEPRFTKSDQEALADIFKKIGQRDMTKVGLQELYNFKQANPRADIEPFISKTSAFFREYIERGLKSIEADMAAEKVAAGRVLADSNSENVSDVGHYLDRLNKLRAQGGLDRGGQAGQAASATNNSSNVYRIAVTAAGSSGSSSEQPAESTRDRASAEQQPRSASPPNVDEIRKRLERIKQSAF